MGTLRHRDRIWSRNWSRNWHHWQNDREIDWQAGYSCQWKQRRPGVQTFVQCNVS